VVLTATVIVEGLNDEPLIYTSFAGGLTLSFVQDDKIKARTVIKNIIDKDFDDPANSFFINLN